MTTRKENISVREDILLEQVNDPDIREMIEDLKTSKPIYQPSKFWIHYLNLNISQLNDCGIENFKQTVNLNSFRSLSPDLH